MLNQFWDLKPTQQIKFVGHIKSVLDDNNNNAVDAMADNVYVNQEDFLVFWQVN